jgi:hypothetical protein
MDSPSPRLPPRHPRLAQLALVRRRLQRRRGTGRAERRRVRPPGGQPPLGIGGGDAPQPIPHPAVEFCILYARRRRRRRLRCSQVSAALSRRDDEREPSDLDPTLAYRFGLVK